MSGEKLLYRNAVGRRDLDQRVKGGVRLAAFEPLEHAERDARTRRREFLRPVTIQTKGPKALCQRPESFFGATASSGHAQDSRVAGREPTSYKT